MNVATQPGNTGTAAEIWFLDVGQGDCTLVIDSESRNAILIDCPSGRADQVLNFARQESISIHTAIVTHWDMDHYGGIARVTAAMPPVRVVYNHDTLFPEGGKPNHGIRTTLLQFLNLDRSRTRLDGAEEGAEGVIGKVHWKMLAPDHRELTEAYARRQRNVASAVVAIEVENTRVLIGGDAVGATWSRLIADGVSLQAHMFRWPHHGADLHGDTGGAVRDQVLQAVQPERLIISAGATNRYGHPSAGTIRAASSVAKVMCTQVTAGCFGFTDRAQRISTQAQQEMRSLTSHYCAGSVHAVVTTSGFTLAAQCGNHQERIDQWPVPLCKTV
ncbi:ComEC/Rec2 family competence protein [Streptomyces sp. NPDC088719]|uniref:ComEC/Rec2 family competence protein n=1 Tax=Streptomyces sp. NPDC088719 TaxID=3365872 RepID=UPI003817EBF1